MKTSTLANIFGIAAILSWGALGLLGKLVSLLPASFVMTICFLSAGLGGLLFCLKSKQRLEINWRIVLASILITAYHLLYLASFAYAPAVEVSLINYLWPACLIVIGNMFFKLNSGWVGYVEASIGFLGVGILVMPNAALSTAAAKITGYFLAFSAAVIWAVYSNFRRKETALVIPSMTVICLLAGCFCGIFLLFIEPQQFEVSTNEIIFLILMSVGPAGGAFFAWDYGMRFGNAAMLTVLGFAAPVISTTLLIVTGFGSFEMRVLVAACLIAFAGWIMHHKKVDE